MLVRIASFCRIDDETVPLDYPNILFQYSKETFYGF